MEHDATDTGAGKAVQQPAAWGEDWRVAECRDQAMLAVAITAMRMAQVVDVGPLASLFPLDANVVEHAARALETVLIDAVRDGSREPRTAEEADHGIRAALDEVEECSWTQTRAQEIIGLETWRPWDSITWWVCAGERVAAARGAVDRMRIEVERRRCAEETSRRQPRSQLRNDAGGRDESFEVQMRRAERLAALLAHLEDRIGPDSPTFWCADQEGPLRLTTASLDHCRDARGPDAERLRRSLDVGARQRREHLERLVAVCAFFKDINSGTFGKWRDVLVAQANRLLRPARVTTSSAPPDRTSVTLWRVMRGGSKAGIDRVTILGTPLVAEHPDCPGEQRPVADGVILVPRPSAMVKRLHTWAAGEESSRKPGGSSIWRAVHAATQVDWEPYSQFIKALSSGQDGRSPDVIIAVWQAFARLSAAMAQVSVRDAVEPPAEFRLTLLLEGLEVVVGGQDVERGIPRHHDDPLLGEGAGGIHLRLPKGGSLPVGTPIPAAQCSRELFEAIEDLDWLLWAIHTVARYPAIMPQSERRHALEDLLKGAKHDEWELLKAKLLSLGDDATEISHCFVSVHATRFRLHGLEAGSGAGSLAAVLIGSFDRCAKALVRRLHEIDPAGLGGLHPPRNRDGAVDVFRWRTVGPGKALSSNPLQVRWVVDPAPFGAQVDERPGAGNDLEVTVSGSSSATEDDVALLSLALDTVRTKAVDDACFAPLVRLGCGILQQPAGGAVMPDVAAALARLREEFAGADRRAFNALIQSATMREPDPAAIRWVRLLRDDVRFDFTCVPPIGLTDDGYTFRVEPVSVVDESWLEWQDADEHAPNEDVSVVYAVDPEHAKRVLSRGRPGANSIEHAVASLVTIVSRELPALRSDAARLRRGIDLIRTFPSERSRVSRDLVAAIGALLDGLVGRAAGREIHDAAAGAMTGNDPLRVAFGLLVQIGEACGHAVMPAAWNPCTGASPEAVPNAERLAVAFHATVPSGSVIVERFGIEGEPGREPSCRRSSGPAPDGFDRLRTLVDGLTGDSPRFEELRQGMLDLPKHVLGDKARLAIPSLYASVWHVLVEHPNVVGDPMPWKEAVAALIRKPYDMVMFEPTKLGDYPPGWIVGPDGNQPRGRRIARVVRPGVRTLERKLVWPAIVDTE